MASRSRWLEGWRHAAPLLLLGLLAAPPQAWPAGPALSLAQAPATGIYRCGSSYSDAPCPGGRPVVADDARSTTQQQQAEDVKRREAGLADRLAAERQARERAAAGQRAAGIGPTAADAARAAASQAKANTTAKPVKAKRAKPKPVRQP